MVHVGYRKKINKSEVFNIDLDNCEGQAVKDEYQGILNY